LWSKRKMESNRRGKGIVAHVGGGETLNRSSAEKITKKRATIALGWEVERKEDQLMMFGEMRREKAKKKKIGAEPYRDKRGSSSDTGETEN